MHNFKFIFNFLCILCSQLNLKKNFTNWIILAVVENWMNKISFQEHFEINVDFKCF
jgi:hypothetical protein